MLKNVNLNKKIKVKGDKYMELSCITDGTPNPPVLYNVIKIQVPYIDYPKKHIDK
jgi:hypothetical protein